jgi:hypothetical protein
VVHERNQLVQHSTVALPQLLEQCGYGLRHRAIIPRRGGWGLGPGRHPPTCTRRAAYRKRGCVVEPTWICRALQRVLPLEDKRPHGDLHQAAVVPAGPAGLAVMVASPCPSPRPPAGGWGCATGGGPLHPHICSVAPRRLQWRFSRRCQDTHPAVVFDIKHPSSVNIVNIAQIAYLILDTRAMFF